MQKMALTNLKKCTWRRNPRIHNNAMCFAERERDKISRCDCEGFHFYEKVREREKEFRKALISLANI
jgi:hypothetical protein